MSGYSACITLVPKVTTASRGTALPEQLPTWSVFVVPRARSQAKESWELIGREAKLEALMSEHSARVLRYAVNRGASRNEAEDVVAEVFLVCWRRLDDIPSPALPWILGVARKVIANQRRSRERQRAVQERVEQSIIDWSGGWVATSPAGGFGDGGLEALARLSEPDREALLLVAWDGLTNKEAAFVLGCTASAFGLRLFRARRRLMKQLEDIRTYEGSEGIIGQRIEP
jgi:RNA polymerase sigma-70 factor (ECF subfamily)